MLATWLGPKGSGLRVRTDVVGDVVGFLVEHERIQTHRPKPRRRLRFDQTGWAGGGGGGGGGLLYLPDLPTLTCVKGLR